MERKTDHGLHSNANPVCMCVRCATGIISGLGDAAAVGLAARHFGRTSAFFVLCCLLGSWFHAFCSSRTLSNTLEAALLPPLLLMWLEPRPPHLPSRTCFAAGLALASISILVRPPSGGLGEGGGA